MKRILSQFITACTRPLRRREERAALTQWRSEESMLRERFLELARAAGKPRWLNWAECEWTGTMLFSRERETGLLTALVGLVVRFEPIEGDEMEGAPAAAMPRETTALFHYRKGHWGTGGRALFNMPPEEAIERLKGQFERIPTLDQR